MACAITSLILVAMFGVMAVGLVGFASLEGNRPARQDRSPAPTSGSANSARSRSFPGAWLARFHVSAR
jgi:hypothetical protein